MSLGRSDGEGIVMDMVKTLNQAFIGLKLDAVCLSAEQHRHFAFYDVQLGNKCRVNKLRNLSNEIALRLKAKSAPIVKSIPEKGIVRLQVVNGDPTLLPFEELYEAAENRPSGILPFLLGETDEGKLLWTDMALNPHQLAAGGTGSGKSTFLHTLIANAAKRQDVKLYLVDSKGVEFSEYSSDDMSDLVWGITNTYASTIHLLEHLVEVMESRYKALVQFGFRSIEQAPNIFDKILVIIDEVSDLMLMDDRRKIFETLIIKLAQKSRAAGIYLVLATQRPSADILTGLIKANFQARLACRVSSRVDSQVILDTPGAELLLGRGDAILRNYMHDNVRFQVAFADPQETVSNYLSQNT